MEGLDESTPSRDSTSKLRLSGKKISPKFALNRLHQTAIHLILVAFKSGGNVSLKKEIIHWRAIQTTLFPVYDVT